jgi:FkbM family methyltransferase
MGIGSGSSVDLSGETILVNKLKEVYANSGHSLCVFDVGSNKGQFLKMILEGLQDIPFSVHAFEPSRHTFVSLSENIKSNLNIQLNNFGLGKERGEFELFYNEIGSGLASLSKRRLEHFGIDFKYSEKVRIDTLDNYCGNQKVRNIDLLKLDVEGHELDALQGGIQMFQGKRIRMVTFEFGGCNIDTRTYFQDFWYFFKKIGMGSILRIAPSGYMEPLLQYKEEYEQFRTTNFLVLQE